MIDMTKMKGEPIELNEKPEMTEIVIEPLENTNLEISKPSYDTKDTTTEAETQKPSHDAKDTTTVTNTESQKGSDVIEVPLHNEEKLSQVNDENTPLESGM